MHKRLNTLKDNIPIIKRLGAEVGLSITDEEIARKMNVPWAQFEIYLSTPENTPGEILTRLWLAYGDLVAAVQRSNARGPIRSIIELLKRLGRERGMDITDEEIAEKMPVPREQFAGYLNGEVETPENVVAMFWSIWPDLFKNVKRISHSVTMEIQLDEDHE